MTTPVRIFGREPAFYVGVIEAALALILSWNVLGLTSNMVGGIMAVVVALSGVYVAYVTRDTMLGVLVGLAKAIIICMATFQITLTEPQITSVIAMVTILGGAFNRSQTAPAAFPSFRDPTPPETYADAGVAPAPGRTTLRHDERGAGDARLFLIVAAAVAVVLLLFLLLNGRV